MPASPRTAAQELREWLTWARRRLDGVPHPNIVERIEAEAAQQAAPLDGWTPEDAAFAEDAIDRAIPDADFGEVARSEVIRSIFRALREQGYTVVPAQARPADAALAHEHDFVDPTNEIVNSNGYLVCRICGRLQQPTPAEGA